MEEVKKYIWDAVNEMLAGFYEGDRPKIDQFLHEDATFWDSSEVPLCLGMKGLNEARARRPKDGTGSKIISIVPHSPIIDVYDDFAICRHYVKTDYSDNSATKEMRNTSFWRKFPNGWFLIHNHEEVI